MNQYYQYRTYYDPISGGYPREDTGVIPNDTSWTTVDNVDPQATLRQSAQYYFRDSAGRTNARSSRVIAEVSATWFAQFLEPTVNTESNMLEIWFIFKRIASIARDDIQGVPSTGGSQYRNLYYSFSPNGPWTLIAENDNIDTAHTIASDINLISGSSGQRVRIAPGGNTLSTVYIKNVVPGHENDPLPNDYADVMGIGTQFMNPMPVDYRPGENWDGTVWMSHNRNGGSFDIWNGTAWQEIRTQGYPTEQNGRATVWRDNGWFNMALQGQE